MHLALPVNITWALRLVAGSGACSLLLAADQEPETGKNMTKVEAIIQPGRFEVVKEALTEAGITGMTISEVRGHGRQKGHTETYRGREYSVDLLPKVKVEVVLDDAQVSAAVDAIVKAASTGKIGDGKIFLSKVDEVIRIRNLERGAIAV
jgi:nitrogen regulatory protein P-II 1